MLTPQHVRRVYVCLVLSLVIAAGSRSGLRAQQAATGGLIESAATTVTRPLAGIAGRIDLPVRGAFTFPAPYSTQAARVTTPADCGGADCVTSVGYSYWRNMNNHTGTDTILLFLTLDRRTGGGGPTLFSYNKTTGETRNVGPLFDASDALSWATGEGWYFSATMPHALYLNSGSQMLRYDVVTHARAMVVDLANVAGPNRTIWQMHSSNDDAVHSFTVEDATTSAPLGCGVYLERTAQYRFFPVRGEYDECQIDKSGRYLVIKENADGAYAEDNVVEDLTTGAESVLLDQNGAMGHSDLGFGYGVGEDNWNAAPGAVRVWRYDQGGITDGRLVFEATDWSFGANHIAHSDARAGLPLEQQVVCSSNANRLSLPHANEILCYRLDGSLNVLVVAPVMTDLDASGGGSDDYTKEPKGNLDVTGEYFLWTSNMGGARQDAFLVHVPLAALGTSAAAPSAPSAPSGSASSTSAAPVPVSWVRTVHVNVSGTTLRKDSGCGGCADAGASSQQQLASGDGYLELVASETNTTREIGLSNGDTGTSGDEIRFGLRLTHGVAEVREGSVYRSEASFATGDRLRVQVANGVVSYAKNGSTFYTSQTAPRYPLLVDTSLNDIGATLTNATVAFASAGASSTSGAASSFWTSIVNATVTAAGLQKTGGCDGCPDAGAVSAARLAAGSGRVDFSAAGTGIRFVGLGPSASPGTGMDLPFAFRLSGATAEVREYGRYMADVPITPSDTLAIVIANNQIHYAKNGVAFYTSASGPIYPLYVSASLYSLGAAVPTPTFAGP